MINYATFADYLYVLTTEKSQYSKNFGHIPRFLDIKTRVNIQKDKLHQYLTVGIGRLYNYLTKNQNTNIQQALSYLFYDLILNSEPWKFKSAEIEIINAEYDYDIDNGLMQLCLYSDKNWMKVHPEYYEIESEIFDNDLFPPKFGLQIAKDDTENSYPVSVGSLSYVINTEYGHKNSKYQPKVIIPTYFLNKNSFSSCWKINHETSIDCVAATYRNVGELPDFSAGVEKIGPFGYDLMSRNDLSYSEQFKLSDSILLLPDGNTMSFPILQDKCAGVFTQDEANKIVSSLERLKVFVDLLCL